MRTTVMRVSSAAMSMTRRLHVPDWLRTRAVIGLVSLLAVTFLGQWWLVPKPPIVFDLATYAHWGDLTRHHFFHVYSVSWQQDNQLTRAEYPPLMMYLFAIVEAAYMGIAHHVFGVYPSGNLTGSYLIVMKMPLILAHLVTVGIMWDIARRLLRPIIAWPILLTYSLCPAVLLDIHAWGQTDDFTLLLVVAALLLALKDRPIATGVVMGLMVVFKPQPLIIVPLVLAYLIRVAGWAQMAKAVAGLVTTAVLLWLPYLIPPKLEFIAWVKNLIAEMVQIGCTSHAACQGYNLWSILPAGSLAPGEQMLGPLTPQHVGYLLFGGALAVVLRGLWKNPSAAQVWAGAAILALAFYVLDVGQFERYVFPAIGLFFLAAMFDRRYWPIYALVSVTAFINFLVILTYISLYVTASSRLRMFQGLVPLSPSLSVGVGAMDVVALLLAMHIYIRGISQPRIEARLSAATSGVGVSSLGSPSPAASKGTARG